MSDSKEAITKKIREKAFSGGGMTKQEHMEKGANLTVDVSYHYLLYFLDDDAELKHIAQEYSSGRMMTSEIKKKATEVIWEVVRKHQEARLLVTDEVAKLFMNPNRTFDHARHPKTEPEIETQEDVALGFHFDPYFRSN